MCVRTVCAACQSCNQRIAVMKSVPVCKLINNGYCQGNVWAMRYNEHSETHQHPRRGDYRACAATLSLPGIPPHIRLCLASICSIDALIFPGYFLISVAVFFLYQTIRRFLRTPRQGKRVCSWLKKKIKKRRILIVNYGELNVF